jgi:hypothetical protein
VPKPPPLVLLAYRFLGWRVGPAHREWVRDDITRSGWLVRQGTPVVAVLVALGGGITAAVDGKADKLLALLVVVTGVGLFLRTSLKERALRQQGIDAAGNPTADWYDDDAARARRNLVSAVATVVLTVAGLWILAVRSR